MEKKPQMQKKKVQFCDLFLQDDFQKKRKKRFSSCVIKPSRVAVWESNTKYKLLLFFREFMSEVRGQEKDHVQSFFSGECSIWKKRGWNFK